MVLAQVAWEIEADCLKTGDGRLRLGGARYSSEEELVKAADELRRAVSDGRRLDLRRREAKLA